MMSATTVTSREESDNEPIELTAAYMLTKKPSKTGKAASPGSPRSRIKGPNRPAIG